MDSFNAEVRRLATAWDEMELAGAEAISASERAMAASQEALATCRAALIRWGVPSQKTEG